MPPLMLDRSLITHAFCFCPFVVASTIPRHCIPWLAVRIVLVAEAVTGFLLSVVAIFLVYWFPALAQPKPPLAVAEQTRAHSPKRRPRPTPTQTTVSVDRKTLPSAVKSEPERNTSTVARLSATPAIALTVEKSPVTSCTPGLPTVVEKVVLHTPPASLPSSPRCLSPAPSEHHKDAESVHASSVASEPAAEQSTKRCRKAAIEALSRGRPVSMPPMERAQTMRIEKASSDPSPSLSPPRRHHTTSMRSMRASLLSEPIRLLSSSPRISERDCMLGKEVVGKGSGKPKEKAKAREKEVDVKSKRAIARTNPYAAPFFFPTPASPDADQYAAALRERTLPMTSPIVSPSPPTAVPSPSLLPAVSIAVAPVTGGSLKGKRRLFGSHKRNKSDVVS